MKCLSFHPEAQIEMVESAKYYEAEQSGLGKRFLEAIRTSIYKVRLFPSIYQRLDGEVRCCLILGTYVCNVFTEKRMQLFS